MRKSQLEQEVQRKKYCKSYIFAILTAIFFGIANFIIEDLAARLGV